MDHPASLGELTTDIPPLSGLAPHNIAYGVTGTQTRIVIKEIPLYRPRSLSPFLDGEEDSDDDEALVVEQAKVPPRLAFQQTPI